MVNLLDDDNDSIISPHCGGTTGENFQEVDDERENSDVRSGDAGDWEWRWRPSFWC